MGGVAGAAILGAVYAAVIGGRMQGENKPGFIKAMWCGCQECEDAMKEEVGVTSRCIPFEQEEFADTCVYCGKPAKKMVYWGKAY